MILILDFNAGNLRNVQKAFERIGYQPVISGRPADVEKAEVIIFPGVGSFAEAMQTLGEMNVIGTLRRHVMEKHKPFLGICLGMQLLAREGSEGGRTEGLGFLPAKVERLDAEAKGLRLPHIGWNSVVPRANSVLFQGIPADSDFYFVHSYHLICDEAPAVAATCEYGRRFVCAVEKDNIFATQFHPEKSRKAGLKVLENFMNYCRSQKTVPAAAVQAGQHA